MAKLKGELQDAQGNVLYPHTDASVVFTSDGGNVETKLNEQKTEITNLKQSVVNGKTVVASAISDKGVPTLATDEFQTMANNISNIKGFPTGWDIEKTGIVSESNIVEGAPVVWQQYGDLESKIDELMSSPIAPNAGNIYTVEFDYVGKYLAIGCYYSPYLFIYKYENDVFTKIANPTITSSYRVHYLRFSPQGNYLFVHDEYNNVLYKIGDDDTFTKCTGINNSSNSVNEATFSYDDRMIVIVGSSANYRHWYTLDGTVASRVHLSTSSGSNEACVFTNDNKYLLISGGTSGPQVYDMTTGSSVTNPLQANFWGIATSNQHNLIATSNTNLSSEKLVIYSYDSDGFTKVSTVTVPSTVTNYTKIRFSSDGNYLMCLDTRSSTWQLHCYRRTGNTFQLIEVFNAPPSNPYLITFSGDGLYFAIRLRYDSEKIYIYRIKEKQLVYPYNKQSLPFVKLAQRSVGVANESANVGQSISVTTFPKFNIL